MDSIAQAVSERATYCGNIVIGNSKFNSKGTNLADCFYTYECCQLISCKRIAHGTLGRQCDDCFGGNAIAESTSCIKCHETTRNKRSFELWGSQSTSDSFYSFGLKNCTGCLFSFHAHNQRNLIGNLKLEPSKYSKIKDKLIADIVSDLEGRKRVPCLLDIIKKSEFSPPPKLSSRSAHSDIQDKQAIETAFTTASKIVFGKPLEGGMDSYRKWLQSHTHPYDECKSAVSGKPLIRSHYGNNKLLPMERLVTSEEGEQLGNMLKLSQKEAEELTLANASSRIGKLAYLVCEFYEGTKSNLIDCSCYIDAANCYRSAAVCYAKYCGYSFWPKGSQYAFGCDTLHDSSSCINCYYSTRLSRCFEVDASENCSDCYLCHNIESCSDCLFCFNVKSKRYAIGNAEYPREEYMKLKTLILAEISGKLEKNKSLEYDIFNIGCKR